MFKSNKQSAAVLRWSLGRLDWHYIAPGKPVQNAFVESYMDPARAQTTLVENRHNSVAVVYPASLQA